jgi:hypothetical protein
MFSISVSERAAFGAQKRVSDNDSSKHCRNASGKQAVIAESMEHEGLQIEKPESRGEH